MGGNRTSLLFCTIEDSLVAFKTKCFTTRLEHGLIKVPFWPVDIPSFYQASSHQLMPLRPPPPTPPLDGGLVVTMSILAEVNFSRRQFAPPYPLCNCEGFCGGGS